jgi:eukaryotic-like serine/threonine-protein kinase
VPTQRVTGEMLHSLGQDDTAGPTAPGRSAHAGAQPPTTTPVTRRSRGRWRTAILVVAIAALVGGGAGLAAMKYGDRTEKPIGQTGTTKEATDPGKPVTDPEAPSSPKATDPVKDVPDGWHRVEDPEGFSLTVPDGWERRMDGNQIDYTPDGGVHYIRISIDPEPDFENAYMHMLSLEKQLSERLPGYRRETLHSNTYRDRPGSLWEFTWTETKQHPGPRHAIDQMYFGETGGPEYALYMTGPEEDWETTRTQFDTMLRSWRAPGDSSD